MITVVVSLLVAVISAFAFFLSEKPKVERIALIIFGCAALVTLWNVGSTVARL